jgi:hypothetical protein
VRFFIQVPRRALIPALVALWTVLEHVSAKVFPVSRHSVVAAAMDAAWIDALGDLERTASVADLGHRLAFFVNQLLDASLTMDSLPTLCALYNHGVQTPYLVNEEGNYDAALVAVCRLLMSRQLFQALPVVARTALDSHLDGELQPFSSVIFTSCVTQQYVYCYYPW